MPNSRPTRARPRDPSFATTSFSSKRGAFNMKRLFQLLSVEMIFVAIAFASNASFAFDPFGGALSGPPGSTVGWGFTISDTVEYVVLDLTDFCPAGLTSSDLYCANGPNGTYTDFAFNAPI